MSKGVYTSGAVLVNEFTVQYSYDSMGRMLRRDNGTDVTTFVWDGWDLLSETTDSVTTTYLVPDGLVWSFSRGEDVFQVHTDALGSVRVVTDSDGDVVARFEFGSWGELLPGSFDNVGLALRFVGALGVRTDLETGLLYMRHRWYCPALQRFISRDPIGLRGGSNAYAYAKLDPVNFLDAYGLKPTLKIHVDQGLMPFLGGGEWQNHLNNEFMGKVDVKVVPGSPKTKGWKNDTYTVEMLSNTSRLSPGLAETLFKSRRTTFYFRTIEKSIKDREFKLEELKKDCGKRGLRFVELEKELKRLALIWIVRNTASHELGHLLIDFRHSNTIPGLTTTAKGPVIDDATEPLLGPYRFENLEFHQDWIPYPGWFRIHMLNSMKAL